MMLLLLLLLNKIYIAPTGAKGRMMDYLSDVYRVNPLRLKNLALKLRGKALKEGHVVLMAKKREKT